MWDLWSTKWYWDRFFPQYFGFPLSISFHQCPLLGKEQKIIIIIIAIFITGLQKKPQDCGASVASAAGPSYVTILKGKISLTAYTLNQ
jgi:hypothetical protein